MILSLFQSRPKPDRLQARLDRVKRRTESRPADALRDLLEPEPPSLRR